jgi:hypothetical protein
LLFLALALAYVGTPVSLPKGASLG